MVAAGIFAIDQLAKWLVIRFMTEGQTVALLGPVLQLHFVRNPGAAFSLASGMTWVLTVVAAVVVVLVIWAAPRIRSSAWAVMLGLLLGGVLGNLTDRLLREPGFGLGYVVDFVQMPWLLPAIWNIADMAILASMAVFLILTVRGVRLDGSRDQKPQSNDSSAETQLAGHD